RTPPSSTLFPYTTLFRSCLRTPVGYKGGFFIDWRRNRSAISSRLQLRYHSHALNEKDTSLYYMQKAYQERDLGDYGSRSRTAPRSEEHTSELQSLAYLVC